MDPTSNVLLKSLNRRTLLQYFAGFTLAAPTAQLIGGNSDFSAVLPSEPLISVWEHDEKVDIAPVVRQVGFNTVWTHDRPYDGVMKLENTLMYRHMNTPGIKHVIAKIERGIWGWTFDQAMRHAEWIATLSLKHRNIVGLYLNDFYGEMDDVAKGGHGAPEFRQIIAKAKSINPHLPIWVPCYPPDELKKAYDFDIDAIIFSFYDTKVLQDHERLLDQALQKFPGKPLMGSLYLDAGSEGRWLSAPEFRQLMDFFVDNVNRGRLCGIRIFRVASLQQRPEYVSWTKEALGKLVKM